MLTEHPQYAIALREARKTYIDLISEAESIYRSSIANETALITDSCRSYLALYAAQASVIFGDALLVEIIGAYEIQLSSYEISKNGNINPVLICFANVEIGLEMHSKALQRYRIALVKCRLANETDADTYNLIAGEIVEREKYITMANATITTDFDWFVNEAKSRKSP